MVYSSIEFLIFLPPVLGLYWASRGPGVRLVVLAAASFAFYAFGDLRHVPLLALAILVGYLGGLAIGRWPGHSRSITALAVAALLANLAAFKYGTFVAENVNRLAPGSMDESAWKLGLPLGISFFTFEIIAYLVDVRAGRIAPQRSLLRCALYVAFFPHLIAGPIVRPGQLFPQFDLAKRWRLESFVLGLQTFLEGLVKKALLADPAGAIADRVFAAPDQLSSLSVWTGVVAYTVQIWADFSGYTDMGRGVARMFGYELPRNFIRPYLASSPSDFWRRWHISLSTWLRDYLYVPLGGNRLGRARTLVNLLVTMLLGGLWHGANWTFILWGGYHGLLLVGERCLSWAWPRARVPRLVSVPLTFVAVLHGWILFRAQSFEALGQVLSRMYDWQSGPARLPYRDCAYVAGLAAVALLAMAVAEYWPRLAAKQRHWGVAQGAAAAAAAAVVFYYAPRAATAFIYFQF